MIFEMRQPPSLEGMVFQNADSRFGKQQRITYTGNADKISYRDAQATVFAAAAF